MRHARRLALILLLTAFAASLAMPITPPTKAGDDAPAGWGTVKGQVVFDGAKLPVPAVVAAARFPACRAAGPIVDEEWVVNPKNLGVKWAVVWLAVDDNVKAPAKKMPVHPKLAGPKQPDAVLNIPCCVCEPHVLAMRAGQTLVFRNSSGVAHALNYQGGLLNPSGNPILNPGQEKKELGCRYSWTPINVGCNLHDWMKAYVRVFDHPYYAVTDADGNFEIKDAPAGDYYLITWHEAVGLKGAKAVLRAGKKIVLAGEPISIVPNAVNEVAPIGIAPDQ
jgi:hypothetical protein